MTEWWDSLWVAGHFAFKATINGTPYAYECDTPSRGVAILVIAIVMGAWLAWDLRRIKREKLG
jgi:hypothetical protein